MRMREFLAAVREIESDAFVSRHYHPALLGLDRAQFEEKKLVRLIAIGNQAPGMKTAQAKRMVWERRLRKAKLSIERFRMLQVPRKSDDSRLLTFSPPPEGINPYPSPPDKQNGAPDRI